MKHNKLTGFSLIELVSVVAITASTAAVLGPTVSRMRSQMQGVSSEGNLHTIGQVSGMYAIDNEDRIFTYTWQGGETYIQLHNGQPMTMVDDQQAGSRQMLNILQRATGRLNGSGKLLSMDTRIAHKRYSHLVLADYMGGNVSDPMWADPSDENLLHWQQNPLEYMESENTFPYGDGLPEPGYDNIITWADNSIIMQWAFASSYQLVPHAWQQDFGPQYIPVSETPHLFQGSSGIELGDRRFNEVRFPSGKVMMFEEFDREQAGSPYFAYDHAQPAKLMFDGSINTMPSGQANLSVSPIDYMANNKIAWSQTYVPLDTFPIPLGGLGDPTQLNQRFRWTLRGLQGIDYTQRLMPSR